MQARSLIRLGVLALVCLGLSSCGPGHTIHLGSPTHDGGLSEAPRDAGRDDDDDDDDAVPCSSAPMCPRKERFCHPERLVCVECLKDSDCKPGEYCDDKGECEDD